MLSERCRRRLGRAILFALASVVTLTIVLLMVRDESDWTGLFSALNVPAISFYGSSGTRVVVIPAVVAAGSLLAGLALLGLRRAPAALIPVVCAWMVFSVSADIAGNRSFRDWKQFGVVERLGIGRAAVVQQRLGGVPPYYQYFMPHLDAVPWDGEGLPPETFVFAEIGAVDLERFGARLVFVDMGVVAGFDPPYDVGLWVMPGPELERLEAAGRLLPDP